LEADFDESGVCESFNGCVAHVVAAAVASFQMLTAAPNSGKCHDLDVCVVKHVVAALVNVGDYVAATSADWACMNSCLFDGRAVGNWDPCEKDAWWRTPDWLRAVRYRSWLATRVCRQWDVLLVPGSCCGWRVRRRVSTGKRVAPRRWWLQCYPLGCACSSYSSSGTDRRGTITTASQSTSILALHLLPLVFSVVIIMATSVQRLHRISNDNAQPVASIKKRTRSRTFLRRTHRR
jgi:hypothetical protein